MVEPGPGELEDGAHADAAGAPVEGVAAGAREQHGVEAEGRGGAEDGAGVLAVDDGVEDRHTARAVEHLPHPAPGGTAHAAEHAAAELVAGEAFEHLAPGGVDGHAAVGHAAKKLLLAEERDGLHPRRQRHADDLKALADEEPLGGMQAVAQLRLGEARVWFKLRRRQSVYLHNFHGCKDSEKKPNRHLYRARPFPHPAP